MKNSDQAQIRRLMKSKNNLGQAVSQTGQKDVPLLGTIPYRTQVTKEFMKQIKSDRIRGIYIQQQKWINDK